MDAQALREEGNDFFRKARCGVTRYARHATHRAWVLPPAALRRSLRRSAAAVGRRRHRRTRCVHVRCSPPHRGIHRAAHAHAAETWPPSHVRSLRPPQGDYLRAAAAFTKALKAVKPEGAQDPELAAVYRRADASALARFCRFSHAVRFGAAAVRHSAR
jgi:hypothetical protein